MYSWESDIVIFERRVTWNYAYSPFKPSLPGSNQPLVKSISSLIYLINLVVWCGNTLEDVFTGRDHQSGESEGTSRDGNLKEQLGMGIVIILEPIHKSNVWWRLRRSTKIWDVWICSINFFSSTHAKKFICHKISIFF